MKLSELHIMGITKNKKMSKKKRAMRFLRFFCCCMTEEDVKVVEFDDIRLLSVS